MATILAHITVKPGAEARWEQIARTLYAATHEHETGVHRYEYWRGAEPGTYYTLLSFDDFNTFIAHQVSDHHEEAAPQIGEVVAGLRLEWVDPIAGASPLPATNGQDLPADAEELFVTYHDRYAAQVAEWWQDLRTST
jgi:quinol monooxygenase YgiN